MIEAQDRSRDEIPGPALRRFHLTGVAPGDGALEPQPDEPLVPLALGAARATNPWLAWPLALDAGGAEPLADRIERALRAPGADYELIGGEAGRLCRAVGRQLEGRRRIVPLGEVLDAALAGFRAEFDVTAAGAAHLAGEIARLRASLEPSVGLVALDPSAPLLLWAAAARDDRAPALEAYRTEVGRLADRLDALLRVDDEHRRRDSAPDTLPRAFGDAAGKRIDPVALAGTLPRPRGSKGLAPERRARIERTVGTLRRWLSRAPRSPRIEVLHAGAPPCDAAALDALLIEDPAGPAAAIARFDRHAAALTDVLRAVRVARLEAAGEYDPELHDEAIERFGGQAFTRDEIRLLPAIAVLETGERLRGAALASLSALLRSGRPVAVLVDERDGGLAAGETWDVLAGYHPGLGYVAMAHREAFVVETTLGRSRHLARGLLAMAGRLRPGVALVTHAGGAGRVPAWIRLEAAWRGRAAPCLVYDPDAGDTWSERFDLSENPAPDRGWPPSEVRVPRADGEAVAVEEPFTFAHAVALDPVYRRHFRLIAREAWGEDQLPLAAWLAAAEDERARRVPYVWVEARDAEPARAVVTRDLAFACRDRARAWRILQELAGQDNAYARIAAAEARGQALAQAAAEREALEARHAAELERVRAEAQEQAIERLVALLMDGATVAVPPPRLAAPAAIVAAPPERTAPAPVEPPRQIVEEEEPSFDEAWVDSPLCTSCNECIHINSKLFRYDKNKQIAIGELSAGTFDQLVRAAEKCPARCIHPGKPRAGDPTASDELIARAAKFR